MIAQFEADWLSTEHAQCVLSFLEVAVKRVLVLIGAGLLMAGCSEASTAPRANKSAGVRSTRDDLTCRSGYIVAYDQNGNPYCVPSDGDTAP
jgi:hypothetical protein